MKPVFPGLDAQIQEIKESVELPLTHPEYYEEMGIKPPKVLSIYLCIYLYNHCSYLSICLSYLSMIYLSYLFTCRVVLSAPRKGTWKMKLCIDLSLYDHFLVFLWKINPNLSRAWYCTVPPGPGRPCWPRPSPTRPPPPSFV